MPTPIQSFWLSEDPTGGWLSVRHNLMGWALSAFSIHKQQGSVQLCTNSAGAEVLIGDLQLPYQSHALIFDDYHTEFQGYGFLKKIHCYALQQQPFIHIDGDAFLFRPLPQSLSTAPLVAQNYEYNHACYEDMYNIVKVHFPHIPVWLQPNANGYVSAANTGVVGGQDWDFYEILEQEILYFLEKNRDFLHLASPTIDFCVFLEQAFFQLLADAKKIEVGYVLDEQIDALLNYRLDRFQDLPQDCGYLHLMNYKRNPTACEQMAQRLYIESPELYERCGVVAKKWEATPHVVLLPAPQFGQDVQKREGLSQEKDWREFRQEKQAFVAALPPEDQLLEEWKAYSKMVNETLALPKAVLLKQPIGHSKRSKRIGSEWNWAEINEFAGQDQNRNVLDNLDIAPAYFEVALYVYADQQTVKEHLLDALNMLLLDVFEESKPFGEGIEEVKNQVLEHQPSLNQDELKETLTSRTRFFLYHGLLEFGEFKGEK